MNILFVCTGNTCRSPMAEALLKHKCPQIAVASAGISAVSGQSINPLTKTVLTQRGTSTNLRTQPVTKEVLAWADIVLTMTMGHKHALILNFPDEQEKYFTLKEYVMNETEKGQHALDKKNKGNPHQNLEELPFTRQLDINLDIADPFGGDLTIYQKTLQEIEENVDILIDEQCK